MNKRLIMLSVMTTLLFFLSAIVFVKTAAAEDTDTEIIASGVCGGWYLNDEDEIVIGENVQYKLYKDGTIVISGSGEMGDYNTWTDCCTKYKMKDLMPWYNNRADIKKVVVKDGVTTIGRCAFYGCKNLESIQWADCIEKVDSCAFYKCSGLKEVRLPSYVKVWGTSVFEECKGLKKVSMDTDFQFNVDKNMQISCDGYKMFKNCTALEEIKLPKSLRAIPSYFVNGCNSLKTFPIPEKVIYWGSYPPSLCKGKFVLPDSVHTLADGAFAGCSGLDKLILPKGLMCIEMAFEGCSSLKTLKIPESVRELSETFYNCTGLEDIVIPDTVQDYNDSWVYSKDGIFEGCSNLKSVVLPDNMEYMGAKFFKNCSSLKKIKLPQNLKEINDYAFEGCSSLTEINLPPKLKKIRWGVFKGCNSLTEIKVPNTVKEIGSHAFSGCTSLEEIDIPKDVDTIYGKTFYNCKNLKRVTVRAEKFYFYGEKIFYGCKKLSGITTYAKNAKKFHILYGALDGVPKGVTVYVPKGSINAYKKRLKGTPGLKDIRPIQ